MVKKYHLYQIIVIFLLCIGWIIGVTQPAVAASQTIRVSPVIINVTLSPGKIYRHEVTIENLTTVPLPFRANLSDFMTGGEDGGYVFEDTKTNPLLKWITLNESEFILAPKEKKQLLMTITTPPQIPVGGYYGILFFEPVVESATQGTLVNSKVGILMLANIGVPDPNAKKAEIETFTTPFFNQTGDIPLLLRVKNISLNFFTAKPIITVKPIFASSGKKYILEDKIIFPGQIRRWTDDTTIHLSPNIYTVTMNLSSGNGEYITTQNYIIVFPLVEIVGILIILYILIFLLQKRNRVIKAFRAFIE